MIITFNYNVLRLKILRTNCLYYAFYSEKHITNYLLIFGKNEVDYERGH